MISSVSSSSFRLCHDVLPTPSNLFSWGKEDTPACAPRQGFWITSSAAAQRFLETGAIVGDTFRRWRWWLRQSVRPSTAHAAGDRRSRPFLLTKAGEKPKVNQKTSTLRTDIVLLSTSSRQAAILELTGLDGGGQRKKRVRWRSACSRGGWKTWCLPFEVSRGPQEESHMPQHRGSRKKALIWLWLRRSAL